VDLGPIAVVAAAMRLRNAASHLPCLPRARQSAMHQVTVAPTPPLRPKAHASRPCALRARSGPRRDIGVDLAFLGLPAKQGRGQLSSRANQTGTFEATGPGSDPAPPPLPMRAVKVADIRGPCRPAALAVGSRRGWPIAPALQPRAERRHRCLAWVHSCRTAADPPG
jgi:hypothetical protein